MQRFRAICEKAGASFKVRVALVNSKWLLVRWTRGRIAVLMLEEQRKGDQVQLATNRFGGCFLCFVAYFCFASM